MPRIQQYKKRYAKEDTADLIRNKMRRAGISQSSLGEVFGISQAAVSFRLGKCNLDYDQLVYIFDKLNFTDDEVLKCMGRK